MLQKEFLLTQPDRNKGPYLVMYIVRIYVVKIHVSWGILSSQRTRLAPFFPTLLYPFSHPYTPFFTEYFTNEKPIKINSIWAFKAIFNIFFAKGIFKNAGVRNWTLAHWHDKPTPYQLSYIYPIFLNNLWNLILYGINISFFDKWKNVSFFDKGFDPESNLGIDKIWENVTFVVCFKWKFHFAWFLEPTPKYLYLLVSCHVTFSTFYTPFWHTMKYPFFKNMCQGVSDWCEIRYHFSGRGTTLSSPFTPNFLH